MIIHAIRRNRTMRPKRPNVVFIVTDQQRYDTIGALGYPFADTPVLDALVAGGTHFSRCYVTGASCVPARASLFTGYFPHTTGIMNNASGWRRTWVELFAAAGYRCVNVGKMHTQPMDAPAGFHERLVVENKDRSQAIRGSGFVDEWDRALGAAGVEKPGFPTYSRLPDYAGRLGAFEWPLAESLHPDVFVGELAARAIASGRGDEPLFLQIGFPGPHPPYDPPAQRAQPYLQRDLPLAPITRADLDGQPAPLRALRQRHVEGNHDSVAHVVEPSPEARRRQRAYYLANVGMIDREVGRILDALRAAGLLENAVVVFTSDHGDCLGDHGHAQKWTMYEQVVRVPLIVWTSASPGGRGEVTALVQQMDVAPTLLELAGIEVPASWEAQSLAPALAGEPFAGRPAVFCEQGRDHVFRFADLMTMMRTQRWKYVHFLGEEGGQLFDLAADPEENVDLWGRPECRAVRDSLHREMLEWRFAGAYRARDWAKEFR
jgi:arylsulfatase A-like enzyme